jgi:predicted esterase
MVWSMRLRYRRAMVRLTALVPLLLAACTEPSSGSSCTQVGWRLSCEHHTEVLQTIAGQREVFWQVPDGPPPEEGWPVVLFFQGAFVPAEKMWDASERAMFGMYDQVRTIEALLDHGYGVITPTAPLRGLTTWSTNVPPWSSAWEGSPDDHLVDLILEGVERGNFGRLDPERLHAVGLSSGGYMSSRMALTYPGRFRSLVIASGSYATCLGPLCNVPEQLPPDHPPTRFLHGGLDVFIPAFTMAAYRNKLEEQGIETESVITPLLGHSWPKDSPELVLDWFEAHP